MKTHSGLVVFGLLITLCAVLPFTMPVALAQSAVTQSYSIGQQPLSSALLQFAEQAGLEVLVDARITQDKTSPGVQGNFTREQALELLLSGTGLSYRYTGDGAVTLVQNTPAQSSAPLVLAPITVVGERQRRTLQQTTSSVTVFDEESVRRSGENGVYQVIERAPNITPAPGEFLPPIRGGEADGAFGLAGNILVNTRPRASLVVDDIPRLSTLTNNSFQSVFDIEQAEVLRGPQTTTRGANAIAGAYIVKTKDPSFTTEAEALGELKWDEIGEFTYRGAAMANLPVVQDELAGRLVIEYVDGRIPVKVREVDGFSVAPPGTDFDQLSEFDRLSLRNKWLYAPEELPELEILTSVEYEKGRDLGFDSFVSDSNFNGGRDIEDRVYLFGEQRIFNTEAIATTLNLSYELSDLGEVRSITSWQRDRFDDTADANQFINFDDIDQQRFNQDLLLTVDPDDGPLSGIVGVTYTKDLNESELSNFDFGSDAESESYAVFLDGAVEILPDLRLLIGGRVQHYDANIEIDAFGGFGQQNDDLKETVILPKIGVAYDVTEDQTVSATLRRGYNPGGAGVDFFSFEAFSFDSEFVWTYEAAYRGTFDDGRFGLDVTAFFNDFTDKQEFFSPTPTSTRIVNFSNAISYGAEIEGRAKLTEELVVNAGLGLLQTEIQDSSTTADGNDIGLDPDVTFTAGAVWSPMEGLEFSGSAQYVAEYFGSFSNTDGEKSGDYLLFDLTAAYSHGPFTVRAFVQNLTDEFAIYQRLPDSGAYVLPPRTFGASLNVKF